MALTGRAALLALLPSVLAFLATGMLTVAATRVLA